MIEDIRYYCSTNTAAWMTDAFVRCGLTHDAAAAAARLLVRTSLRGIDTHGVARVPAYIQQLRSGMTRTDATPRTSNRGGFLHCDGDGGLGQLVASCAMEAAVRQARDAAMVACTVSNSGHMGALGLYALQASEQGLIAFICQRTPPIMALPGATARAIGNNPLAYSFPVPGRVPLVFDMASSEVARGRVMAAARTGASSIPAGWAIDQAGTPTTDPLAALAGAMLPMSGHKGIGLAMLVECLAGSLCGVERDADEAALPGGGARASAFLLVINPERVCGREAFERQVEGWIDHYLAASGAGARYPGERQARCEAERLASGLPLDAVLVGQLREAGALVGKPFDLEPMASERKSA